MNFLPHKTSAKLIFLPEKFETRIVYIHARQLSLLLPYILLGHCKISLPPPVNLWHSVY